MPEKSSLHIEFCRRWHLYDEKTVPKLKIGFASGSDANEHARGVAHYLYKKRVLPDAHAVTNENEVYIAGADRIDALAKLLQRDHPALYDAFQEQTGWSAKQANRAAGRSRSWERD